MSELPLSSHKWPNLPISLPFLGRFLDAFSDIEEVFQAKGSLVVLHELLWATCSAMLSQAEICVFELQTTSAMVAISER